MAVVVMVEPAVVTPAIENCKTGHCLPSVSGTTKNCLVPAVSKN